MSRVSDDRLAELLEQKDWTIRHWEDVPDALLDLQDARREIAELKRRIATDE